MRSMLNKTIQHQNLTTPNLHYSVWKLRDLPFYSPFSVKAVFQTHLNP